MSALTERQRRAARHLARGLTQATTGERVGVSSRTIQYWLRDIPGFREASQDLDAASSTTSPTETLEDLLHDPDAKVRLQAATALLRLTEDGSIQPEPGRPTITILERPARAAVPA